MPLDITRARQLLAKADLRALFVEELGWDRHPTAHHVVLDESLPTLSVLAHKRGMVAYQCPAPTGEHLPDYAQRRKIEEKVAKLAHEHLIVFTDARLETQIWQWVKREPGKPAACREHTFHRTQPGDSLLQKLENIAFALQEEDALTLLDVTQRARTGFDVERVTKRFYDRFQKEHTAFLKFITGITDRADREWYASVMLNRLMFVYFIQRKGFLDGDPHYLRNRLTKLRGEQGNDKFYSFYRYFLLRLFHEGLGGKRRSPELEKLVGRIPYLNGGIFDVHELEKAERNGSAIQIPDEAFEAIFDYFDQYQWHLDERPLRADNEINPDVLGYIFEKYINQKQMGARKKMGAYYTKEDITEYIGKNAVLPFLLDATRAKCKVAFENAGGPTVWDLLKRDPDRYIYGAVRHGAAESLPEDIAAGLDPLTLRQPVGDAPVQTLELRKGWNRPALASHALPTETWREAIARRHRYEELKAKLAAGEVRDVNELITLNLDIRQFAQDVVENCEGPDLLRAVWHAIEKITILDPTCGSGAFLFAALNILEPLYEACLDRMQAFIDDLSRSAEKHRLEKFSDFRKVLDHMGPHSNRRSFIFKSIILNNLFGVDIMEEAVEICKLRLFLKLAAQVEPDPGKKNLGIEPLPDIDFNIRAGNTLVGYPTYDEVERTLGEKLDFDNALKAISSKAAELQRAFDAFRARQVGDDNSTPTEHKEELRKRLAALGDELNHRLASAYGVAVSKKEAFAKWVKSHQPFHWFVEFYGIVSNGGFDVIIGNPPYVEYRKIEEYYTVQPVYKTLPCGNLYTLVLERCYTLARDEGRVSMIVPLSLVCTSRTDELRELITQFRVWISAYDMRPSSAFEGVAQRLSIIISQRTKPIDKRRLFVGGYRRWAGEERPVLMDLTSFVSLPVPNLPAPIPKLSSGTEQDILSKIAGGHLERFTTRSPTAEPILVHRIVRYFVKALNFVPLFVDTRGRRGKSEDYKTFDFVPEEREMIAALLNSTLFYWFWRSHGDGFHCGYNDVYSMPYKKVSGPDMSQALKIALISLMQDLQRTSEERAITTKAGKIRYQEFYPALSKTLLDRIDETLGRHYGFTEEELDLIVNYDIKYRMGRNAEDEDED